ncbi:MAG: CoA transferase [Burkholderiaceae bacterium]|jgi:crotonobetainyl-CoA:carnitine CoA-transferase CaiB-like acyl-CoA transferase|nr:CoA transferase [Burkholderiales bacterium]NCA09265.1 CoA transferase [Burkholderiaceae bacterium]NCV71804.1 CoA transferase [Burkholderiaceae bacterium]NDA17551.1 CoA transferase [Burkholderiaceae bacterium]NDC50094.1 CoA transferase [Burkholderiaceae bacterium]
MNTADLSALKPLAGIRVLEICNVAAGPFCALLLADLGADVIKLENPGAGDTLRAWPPHTGPENDRLSENFASLNRNKRSVTLDLKNPDDNAKAKNLIANADVLIENNRPGVMKRLGLDFDSALAINPKLIYCSISAYGQTGPRANEGGFDVTIQAMSGIMSVTGEPDGAPVKCGVPVADFTAGLYGAMSICAQLRAVAQTGKGVHIDVPMMGTSLAIAALQTSEYFGVGKDPVKLGSAHPRNAPYQAFKAKDDYLVMAAGTQALWETVCQILKSPELLKDERFTSTALRAKNQIALKELIEVILQKDTAANWIAQFSQAGVPCCPINQYSAVLNDPQTLAMGWVQPMVMANGQQTKTVINPIKFNGTTAPIERRPPRLGEHNSEIVE